MSTQDDSPSAFPSSMGPGARPIPGARPNQNNPRDRQSTLQQVMEIRSKYNVESSPNGVSLDYELNGMPRHYNLSFEAIPLGGFQQWVLFGREGSRRISGTFLIDCIRGGENMTGRLMSRSEAEGFALHSSKRMMYSYLTTFTALFGGYGIAYTGIKNMKFPFIKAKGPEKYQNFPNRFVPILKGKYARIMWQVTRFNVYAVLGIFVLSPISRSISNTSMMVGLYNDPRTQEYMKSVKGTLDRITSNPDRSKRGLPSNTPQSQPQPSDQDDGSSEDYGGVTSNTTSDSYGGDSTFTDNTTDTGLMTNSTMQQRAPAQPSPYNRRPQAPSPPSQQPQQPDYFFDDASPTAGNQPYSPSSTTTHRSEGSIWDRIRKDQRQPSPSSPSSSDQTQEQPSSSYSTDPSPSSSASPQPGPFRTSGSGDRSSSTSAESFSFSSSDEERVVAKQQAQREFDEMLERERREGEMGGGGGGGAGIGDDGRGGGGGSGSAWGRRRGG